MKKGWKVFLIISMSAAAFNVVILKILALTISHCIGLGGIGHLILFSILLPFGYIHSIAGGTLQ